jgi:hypothetical protein
MDVVDHEHIGVHGAAEALGQLGEMIQIESLVFLGVESPRAVITALDDVPGDAGEAEACSAWHDGDLDGREDQQVY